MEMPLFKKIWKPLLLAILCVAGGITFGIFVAPQLKKNHDRPARRITEIRLGLGEHQFTNPLLDCEVGDAKDFTEFNPLRNTIETAVKEAKDAKQVTDASVYFRGLNNGRWVGINENQTFAAASLAKVPLMFTYLKMAESQPDILKKQLTYDGSFNDTKDQNIKPSHSIGVGKSYTVDELIYRMIVYSGNNSTHLLANNIDSRFVTEVFDDLHVQRSQDQSSDLFVSTKDFSSFFRVLYNASYLSQDMSEKALALLSQAEFKNGLANGVPSDVPMAHKFGERVVRDPSGTVLQTELHDCGIIYQKKHPYILCIMTRGDSFADLEHVIQHISQIIYNVVDGNYPTPPKKDFFQKLGSL